MVQHILVRRVRRHGLDAVGARVVAAAFTAALLALPAAAQEEPEEKHDRYSVSELGLNFDVPESPAFTVLGLNPQNVTRPATPRDFAAAVLNGLDRNGNFQSGIAVEFNPWGIYNRNSDPDSTIRVSENDTEGYVDGNFTLWPGKFGQDTRWLRYLWYRTSFSFATAKGSDDEDEALRLAAGVRVTPWDPGDSRLIVGYCVLDEVKNLNGMVKFLRPENDGLSRVANVAPPTIRAMGEGAHADSNRRALEALEALDFQSRFVANEQSRAYFEDALAAAQEHLAIRCSDPDRCGSVADVDGDLGTVNFERRVTRFVELMSLYAEAKAKADANVVPVPGSAPAPPAEETDDATKRAIREALAVLKPASPAAETPATIAGHELADAIVKKCRQQEKGRWNGSSWDVSLAPSWISQDGTTDDTRWNGGAIWSSLALGPDLKSLFSPDPEDQVGRDEDAENQEYFQVVLHGRYRFEERASNTKMDGTFVDQDTWLLGARLRFLLDSPLVSIQGVGVSFEGALSNTNVTDSGNLAKAIDDDTFYQFALVPTFRVPGTENMWLDVAFGTETGRKGGNDAFVLSSIKYGYGQGPWPSHAQQ